MRNDRILDAIDSPSDLKVLSDEELNILAQEIREQIIATTSKTGGHVASSLGAVEIILAAHSVLDAPRDKLIFDVGHQAYAHKLVTGRRDAFDTLRSYHGISGFPRPSESPYDVHPSGHASDSLSVAAGLAKARKIKGTDERVVAVIGDAALSGGMAFEALNYVGQEQLPLVIILNDNEMSISRNVGALMRHLGNMRATSQYRDAREALQERLESGGAFGNAVARFGKNVKESMKQFVIPHSMIFEQLGIVCTAPIDGHDIRELRETLSLVLAMDAPVLMHVVTKKGAGYGPARKDPERFHGVGPYDVATGASTASPAAAPSYTSVFGEALVREAALDPRVVAITAAMEGGTGLKPFARAYPERFVDVGIAEEQAVGMASGLAAGGSKPVVAIYSTFLQRAVDQMIVNVALPKLDVVFALDRAGLVGNDGPTHHGVFDLVYARMIPHMRVLAPSDEAELACALHTALVLGGPFAIRYPRGAGEGVPVPKAPAVLAPGVSRVLREGDDACILAFGHMVPRAVEAARLLEERRVSARVVDMRWVKPLDREAIRRAASTRLVVTVEEGVVTGGAGEGVLGVLSELGAQVPTRVLGLPDDYVLQGKVDLLLRDLGLDAEGIAATVADALGD
ncbi:1-deoxy-D-xylulose-5-phosphate synthase [Adlercreutzia sp. ZJ242]|uniref:1-deoxy-D-xylulose-5-phosphate synthase n=1 Tax=Adlercreutzia sp. ZJ242 TaxID=2709409 RepID=UPI0013EA3152|nr:1-deoxy-D-xylulose-5-phosphate synthase [Adlercreutzia sp. ZJ242]